jgi:hypothetical protein
MAGTCVCVCVCVCVFVCGSAFMCALVRVRGHTHRDTHTHTPCLRGASAGGILEHARDQPYGIARGTANKDQALPAL